MAEAQRDVMEWDVWYRGPGRPDPGDEDDVWICDACNHAYLRVWDSRRMAHVIRRTEGVVRPPFACRACRERLTRLGVLQRTAARAGRPAGVRLEGVNA